jgi:Pro-kumamolisin, activation domain
MAKSNAAPRVPADYSPVEGSERRPGPSAKLLGPADPGERIAVTIVVRRRPDGEPVPDFEDFVETPPHDRPRLSLEEFAAKYGASPGDLKKVTDFAAKQGLTVEEANAARRSVVVSGSVDQMAKAFAVSLGTYEHTVVRRRGEEPVKERYRGRDGLVHVPKALAPIVVGVFGLDNRRVIKHNSADPPNTHTLPIETITQLYGFPTNSAAGQTIGILSEAGYRTSDVSTSFGGSPPTVTDVTVDASNDGTADAETTQDIVIAAKAAPGAAIAVYFTTYDQQGWVDLIQRVVHPQAGDPACSVISSSFYVSNGDDATTLTNEGISTSWLTAVTEAFQDAAIQGVTVCIACGDTGTDSKVGDGNAHVQYPGSDPWVLSVGGTTIGNVSGSSFDEYVWNDPDPNDASHWGTTGGGVSDFFGLPAYQTGAGVPRSLNDNTHVGRGVPDVAANASFNAGYTGITVGGSDFVGNGTSASAPLWAGLIAVINAALGVNVGFVNPALYRIGSWPFRDLTGAAGPADNANGGVAGYPAGVGWDACTGWGSPNGTALLTALRALYNRSLYFVVDKSTFGHDEVDDVIATGGGLYSSAFWLVLEGFSINEVGSTTPSLSGAFHGLAGASIFPDPAGADYEYPGDLYTPQRIRFPYDIVFTSSALAAFPAAGDAPTFEPLHASISVAGTPVEAEAVFELVAGADPYFTNVDPLHDNAFYLSQDLRVFSAADGDAPLPGGPTLAHGDPYAFIQDLIGYLNSTPAYTTPGLDPLNALPGQTGYETADSSVTPVDAAGRRNFNFAIARVRLQDAPLVSAEDVRVFFRMFVAQSCDTDFQPATTYKSTLGTTGADAGKPVFPLPSGTGLMDPSGQSIQTLPFFATDASGTHDYDSTVANANIRTIQLPGGHDKVWAYFGCFLDVYDASNQPKFGGTHHCLVAEIAYDEAPIMNSGGVTESPENSDKLAQRNLQIVPSGNPGYPQTHQVPMAFDTRPSPQLAAERGALLDYPDELMVDWGNTPTDSRANLYWPAVDAAEVTALADGLYGAHSLEVADPHTIACAVTAGVTYIPIPPAVDKNFAGLLTVDLPNTVRVGQELRVKVRRISSRRPTRPVAQLERAGEDAEEGASRRRKLLSNWRYVTGTFQLTIPVEDERALLEPEETTLAVLKWRLEHMPAASRWRPVIERYAQSVAGRVEGFGGDPGEIAPSLTGVREPHVPGVRGRTHVGKVCEVVYDCFGDVEAVVLERCGHERQVIRCRQPAVGDLLLRACRDRLRVAIVADGDDDGIVEVRLSC